MEDAYIASILLFMLFTALMVLTVLYPSEYSDDGIPEALKDTINDEN